MQYAQCLAKMYALRRFGIVLGLEEIRGILKNLGDPHKAYACVHVAGSNGKGSIAAMVAAALQNAGLRVGLFTSPHLVSFNERIRINGHMITDAQVVDAYKAVNKAHRGRRSATFFEIVTAMAFTTFARSDVDWAVIETGMGGRLDATNIVTPAVTLISNISLEHRAYLGNTLAEIAAEKAGIIKTGVPLVTGVRQKAVIDVIESTAANRSATCFRLGRDFRVRRRRKGGFHYYGLDQTLPHLKLNLIGRHQVDNAALALAACELLSRNGVRLTSTHLRAGLEQIDWPARLQIVAHNPLVLLDGAHNLAAARNLARYLRLNLSDRKLTLVTGILDDKPYRQMLSAMAAECKRVIVTRPQIGRALAPETLAQVAAEAGCEVVVKPTVPQALQFAIDTSAAQDAVCVAGSMYVVGEAIAHLKGRGRPDPGEHL